MQHAVERPIPTAIPSERAVLGSVLLERDAILVLDGLLLPSEFALQKHAWIYTAMQTCASRQEPPDLVTVAEELRCQGHLDAVGGMSFLAELAMEVPTAVHVEYYARTIKDAALLRRLIQVGGQMVSLGYRTDQALAETVQEAESLLLAALTDQSHRGFHDLAGVCQEYYTWLATIDQDGERGLLTGFPDLDDLMRGLQPGNLVILGGRPGQGKTSFALSLAYAVGVQRRQAVGIVSLEMGRNELLGRLVAIHTGLDTRTCRARPTDHTRRLILDALGVLSASPIYIEDTAAMSIGTIRSKARRLRMRHPLDLLIVDYLQLATGDRQHGDRREEVDAISRGLKALARELGCPVLALAQLSRAVEQRASHVPTLADLRESGQIEADADVVLFIYRKDMYEKETAPHGLTEIHVAKHRNGPLGVVPLHFEGSTTRLRSLERYRTEEAAA